MTSSLPASPVHTLYYYNPLILNTTSLHLVAQDDFILLLMLLLPGFIPHHTALSVYQDSAQITSPWSLTQCHWYLSPPPRRQSAVIRSLLFLCICIMSYTYLSVIIYTIEIISLSLIIIVIYWILTIISGTMLSTFY